MPICLICLVAVACELVCGVVGVVLGAFYDLSEFSEYGAVVNSKGMGEGAVWNSTFLVCFCSDGVVLRLQSSILCFLSIASIVRFWEM